MNLVSISAKTEQALPGARLYTLAPHLTVLAQHHMKDRD